MALFLAAAAATETDGRKNNLRFAEAIFYRGVSAALADTQGAADGDKDLMEHKRYHSKCNQRQPLAKGEGGGAEDPGKERDLGGADLQQQAAEKAEQRQLVLVPDGDEDAGVHIPHPQAVPQLADRQDGECKGLGANEKLAGELSLIHI